jgi:hypothetical protein
MAPQPQNTCSKHLKINGFFSFDNIWKISLFCFMVASLYLQNNFLSKADFIKTQDRVRQIEVLIGQLEIKARVDEQQTKTLESIESRLRQIERDTAVLMSRSAVQ